ncbi:MAG: hypothetical protein V1886_03090 [archaeon]
MAQKENVLDCTQYMKKGRERSNIADGLNEINEADPYISEKERNSNTKRNLKMKGLDRLVAGALLSAAMIFNPLTGISKAVAAAPQPQQQQQYEFCDTQNPNYCIECRGDKRNFAKCGEIDYTQGSLHAAGRTYIHKDESFPFPLGIDYDPYTNKAVYCAHIGKEGAKLELFIIDAHMEGNKMIINDFNKKRITWNSAPNQIANTDPLWTKDREIIFMGFDKETKQKLGYLIDADGSNKKYITPDEYAKLWLESHDRNTGLVNVAPAN